MNAMKFLFNLLVLAATVSTALTAERTLASKKVKPRTRPEKLFGITWQANLDAATKAAKQTPGGKPIVLLRVLGDLDDRL
jgi:hypothetical protein